MQDVRRYLQKASINKDGVIVVKKSLPFQAKQAELIVIPRYYAPTLVKCLHDNSDHPSNSQMKKLIDRSYFILDDMDFIKNGFNPCDSPCQALRILPKELVSYSTETKESSPGRYFHLDVLEDYSQKIAVMRDNLSSFTVTELIPNQQKDTLRDTIIILSSRVRLGSTITIRVDAQSSLKSLAKDDTVVKMGIIIDVGQSKNKNKNSVAAKAIQELREQILKIFPSGGPISPVVLARATNNLNSLIQHSGRSAIELWTSRDQSSGDIIQIDDQQLSDAQNA